MRFSAILSISRARQASRRAAGIPARGRHPGARQASRRARRARPATPSPAHCPVVPPWHPTPECPPSARRGFGPATGRVSCGPGAGAPHRMAGKRARPIPRKILRTIRN